MVEKIPNKIYERELARLQEELVKMEEWIYDTKARVAVVFAGAEFQRTVIDPEVVV